MRAFGRFLGRVGRFLLSYLISLVFHWPGAIPAVLLLVLHFWPGIPLFWFWIALGIWLFFVLIRILFLRFAIRSAEPTPVQINKNPYSRKSSPEKPSEPVPAVQPEAVPEPPQADPETSNDPVSGQRGARAIDGKNRTDGH